MNYASLEQKIGCKFKNPRLLKEALTHRSYINENRANDVPHNERLEFLGDAVLQIVVTEHLFNLFPTKMEGELTAIRSHIVNSERASEVSDSLGLNDFLFLSRGEQKDIKSRRVILANAFEAILGAIRLDQGMEKAREVIERLLLTKRNLDCSQEEMIDPKSLLQEQIQDKLGITPSYQVIQESGPDHDKKYVMGVYFGGSFIAQGEGSTKAKAEKAAAKVALTLMEK